jgi:rhodanese-related sulfurtransferase
MPQPQKPFAYGVFVVSFAPVLIRLKQLPYPYRHPRHSPLGTPCCVTKYEYNPVRRWLTRVTTERNGAVYQDIQYEFDRVGNIKGYINGKEGYPVNQRYMTKQKYEYDGLYQLVKAEGESVQYLYGSGNVEGYRSNYRQDFAYDGIGNLTKKTSVENKTNRAANGMDLNYTFEYEYYKEDGRTTHRAERIGDMYYRYDGNGNITEERAGGRGNWETGPYPYEYHDGIYSTDYGFAPGTPGNGGEEKEGSYARTYSWDYRNQLLRTKDGKYTVHYRYGQDGQRAVKYTEETGNETVYFNQMRQTRIHGSGSGWVQSKHIFVGETRIATKSNEEAGNGETAGNLGYEINHQYWYHGGSSWERAVGDEPSGRVARAA